MALRGSGDLERRSGQMASKLWAVLTVVLVLFLAYTAVATKLFTNYLKSPLWFALLILPVGGLVLSRVYMGTKNGLKPGWLQLSLFWGLQPLPWLAFIQPFCLLL